MADVVIVGGGVGGLAAAIRLRAAGHQVIVVERNAVVGGKLAVYERDGFVFDTGPSLLTLPHVFDEVFRLAGTTLADEVDLVRLDPQFRYYWPDGHTFTVRDDGCDVDGYAAFVARGKRIWEVSERTFFAGPMSGPISLMRRLRRPSDLTAIDPLRTLHHAAIHAFGGDLRMAQWAGRYATYSGSSPYAAPATLACIAHVEHAYGCWYPMGGLGAVRDALERAAVATGVDLRTGHEAALIDTTDARPARSRVTGVHLADGTFLPADIVVANADATHLYRDLLPDTGALRRVRRASPSTSGFVINAGVRGITDGIAHHTIWFGGDDRAEFAALSAGQAAPDPTIYACVSSRTDPSQAPDGHENWFILVNMPAGISLDRDTTAARILDILAARGTDLRDRTLFVDTITPDDIAERYRSPGGAIYGTSSNGRRAAFRRPSNRGPRRGLYLVGGSSHPGGGLPLVAMSGRIVADMIAGDLRSGYLEVTPR